MTPIASPLAMSRHLDDDDIREPAECRSTLQRAADAQLSLRRALAHLSIARREIQSVADDALGRAVRENADDALGQVDNAIQSTEGALRAAVVASGMAEVVDPVAASQADTLARFERFIGRAS